MSSCLYRSTNCLSCESGEVIADTPIHTELGDNAETDVPEVIQSYPQQGHARSAYLREPSKASGRDKDLMTDIEPGRT